MRLGAAGRPAGGRGATKQGDVGRFAEVLQIIHSTGALEFTRQQAMREAESACAAITAMAGSKYKQCLLLQPKLFRSSAKTHSIGSQLGQRYYYPEGSTSTSVSSHLWCSSLTSYGNSFPYGFVVFVLDP